MAPVEIFRVDATASGMRLDAFLRKHVPGATARQVDEWIRTGAVRIRGKLCKPLRRIHRGDEVTLTRPPPRAVVARTTAVARPPVRVLYESQHLVGVDKPAGWAVEPELVNQLALQLGGWNVEGQAAPGLVHRLDRDTSGCMLLARTDFGVSHLRRSFEAGTIDKVYWVAVLGHPPAEGRIETPYSRNPANPRQFTTRAASARRAALRFRTVRAEGDISILEVRLETGRTHQIRVQFAESGWPILGDAVYGTEASRTHPRAPPRQALHAARLTFPTLAAEPGGVVGRTTIESPLPSALALLG